MDAADRAGVPVGGVEAGDAANRRPRPTSSRCTSNCGRCSTTRPPPARSAPPCCRSAAAPWPRPPPRGRSPNVNKPGLAEDAEAALKEWGESPPPALALAPGASEFEAARLFQTAGRSVRPSAADKPEAVARALDLLELPVPAEGVQAVVAFFDADKRLTETLVLYRANDHPDLPGRR